MEDDVWIGAGAIITDGVTVGKGAVDLGSEQEREEADKKREEAEEAHKSLFEALEKTFNQSPQKTLDELDVAARPPS